MKFGLVGEKLEHSFSKEIHSYFAKYDYDYFEVKKEDFDNFIKTHELDGFNVTIPYKKEIIKYCDFFDDYAVESECVNTVICKNGYTYGYNTDYLGLRYLIEKNNIQIKDKKALILGDGATSNMTKALLRRLGVKKIIVASRKSDVKFNSYSVFKDVNIIVNTTPVGMFPKNSECLVDLDKFTNLDSVIDLIYNPLKTKLVVNAEKKGIKAIGGLDMLVSQAKAAAEIFSELAIDKDTLDDIVSKIKKEKQNIVLIGMPGVGKTSVGEVLSNYSNKKLIDIDSVIEKEYGDIEDIFLLDGEDKFRELEKNTIEKYSKYWSSIISVGGGAVLNEENMDLLKQNGLVIYLKRELDNLAIENRPLSKGGKETIERLYKERHPLYSAYKDFEVDIDSFDDGIKKIIELI